MCPFDWWEPSGPSPRLKEYERPSTCPPTARLWSSSIRAFERLRHRVWLGGHLHPLKKPVRIRTPRIRNWYLALTRRVFYHSTIVVGWSTVVVTFEEDYVNSVTELPVCAGLPGVMQFHTRHGSRLMLGAWLLTCLVVSTYFTSLIVAALTVRTSFAKIDSVEDLVKQTHLHPMYPAGTQLGVVLQVRMC